MRNIMTIHKIAGAIALATGLGLMLSAMPSDAGCTGPGAIQPRFAPGAALPQDGLYSFCRNGASPR